ncbi:Hypothetical predicted protein [Lecanosticta acicola]|uniref:feruloyl esterase n=1 Tax=Lecanosticta acicola TaxID=111012 RepID=A0AAI9E8Y8_9PEZI|nr:Hypothetical predicted protein [Lecanosticta acicola]
MLSTASLALFLGAASALTASSGCGIPLAYNTMQGGTGSSNTVSLTSNGISRTFLLHIPTNYDANSPRGLIFSYAGRGATAAQQEQLSSFSDPYFNEDLLAVYPQGVDNQFQGDPAATTNDVQFTLDILDYVSGSYCIDTDRVFSSGKSNGGGFSLNILACDEQASARFAAFSGCSGAYYQANAADGSCSPSTVSITCSPSRPVPILEFHGSADPVIPYTGGERRGECLPAVDHFIQNWAYLDGLQASNVTQLYDGNVVETQYAYSDESALGLVTNFWVNGLTHSWAATVPNGDSETPTYFNATSIIMDWFAQHPLK